MGVMVTWGKNTYFQWLSRWQLVRKAEFSPQNMPTFPHLNPSSPRGQQCHCYPKLLKSYSLSKLQFKCHHQEAKSLASDLWWHSICFLVTPELWSFVLCLPTPPWQHGLLLPRSLHPEEVVTDICFSKQHSFLGTVTSPLALDWERAYNPANCSYVKSGLM